MSKHYIQIIAIALSTILAFECAHARGDTGDESTLAVFESRSAPLAISSNGQFRVHVDSKGVLHRVSMQDVKQEQHFALPGYVIRIAASRTAQKVAFTSSLGCVGLIDFGSPAFPLPKLSWISNEPIQPAAKFKFLEADQPLTSRCNPNLPGTLVALSTDGKLVATETHVYDLESQTLMATLPSSYADIGRRRTLAIQFTDNNTKLFLATATLGAGYESPDMPSDMQFSLWDLRRKTLLNLVGGSQETQFVPESFLYSYSAQTGALVFVNSDRYFRARADGTAGDGLTPLLDVFQTNLHTCQSKLTPRLAITPWQWNGYVVDPLGRWIAGVRNFNETGTGLPGRSGRGFAEELQFLDLSSGKLIENIPLTERLHGLSVTPDGAIIFGMTPFPIDPKTGTRMREGGEVIQIKVHPDALGLQKAESVPFAASPCNVEDESTSARSITKNQRLLQPVWSQTVESPGKIRTAIEAVQSTNANPNDEPIVCNSIGGAVSFSMSDKTLWSDRYTQLTKLDWTTGRIIGSLPTSRKRNVCTTVVPETGGLINFQGDTVSFQAFENLAFAGAKRQVVEVKRGWYASDLTPPYGADGLNTVFRVLWRVKPGTAPPTNKQGNVEDALLSSYEASSKGRIQEVSMHSESYEMGFVGDSIVSQTDTDCSVEGNAVKRVLSFEASYFESFRARRCADRERQETIFWSGLDITPRQPTENSERSTSSRALAFGDSIGIGSDVAGLIHIFEIHAKKELAQIQLLPRAYVMKAILSEKDGVVVLEVLEYVDNNYVQSLRAYSFR